MNYEESIEYIKGTARFGSNYGLIRTEKILEYLGNPHKKLKCIHVAGTNGKGSTSTMITQILIESGYCVGMYTSPFLEEFEERIQINGESISKEDLSDIVTEVSNAVENVIQKGYGQPTQFEIITCVAFLYYSKQNVDYAVIEVGLGGRLDSTNVINPIVSVIASISYDHTNILGNTLSEITYEKAGIIKPGVPVIIFPQQKEVSDILDKICMERGSKCIKVLKENISFQKVIYENNNTFQTFQLISNNDIYNIKLSLLGKHQLFNCAVAVYTIEELINQGVNVNKIQILSALEKVVCPGRMEIMNYNPLVIIDGAHNTDGMRNLKESLSYYFKYSRIILILGILADKQVDDIIEEIVPISHKVVTVTPHNNRAELAEKLMNKVYKLNNNCEYYDDYETAFDQAFKYCNDEDMLLISGSLYMIGDMRKIIINKLKKQS